MGYENEVHLRGPAASLTLSVDAAAGLAVNGVSLSSIRALSLLPVVTIPPASVIAETCPRRDTRSTVSPPSGAVRLVGVMLPKGLVLTSLGMVSLGTPLSVGTHQIFGVYDSALNLLRSTVDDGANAWAANAAKELLLTAQFTTTYEGLHYFGYTISASVVPDVCGDNGPVNSGVYSLLPYTHISTTSAGATALPNPAVFSAALDRTPYIYAK